MSARCGSALTFRIGLPALEYPTREAVVAVHHAILDRLSALPGVTAASATTCLPLAEEGICAGGVLFMEDRAIQKDTFPPPVGLRAVAGGYFDAIGMRIFRGRGIDRGSIERREGIVVVNSIGFPNVSTLLCDR